MTTRPGYVWDATASEWVEIGQAAVVAPIAYQTSEPSSPATGDIWIDSDDEVPSVDSTLYYRWTKTMSGGETSLSGTDDNSLALEYTPGYESVFINGVLQVRGSDYTATTGTTVTGLTALTASDVLMVESIVAYSVGDTYTQTQIQTFLAGSVAQVVTASTSTEVSSTSATYVDTNLTATITPKYATSKILVIVNQFVRVNAASGAIQILRGASVIWTPGQLYALACNTDNRQVFSTSYLDSPATTSATTYKTQFARNSGTVVVNPNSCLGQITLMEIRV